MVSRDGFGLPVPRQPAHCSPPAESSIINHQSGAYLRDSPRFPRRRPFIYLYRQPPSGQSLLESIRSSICTPMAFTAEGPPAQGQINTVLILSVALLRLI